MVRSGVRACSRLRAAPVRQGVRIVAAPLRAVGRKRGPEEARSPVRLALVLVARQREGRGLRPMVLVVRREVGGGRHREGEAGASAADPVSRGVLDQWRAVEVLDRPVPADRIAFCIEPVVLVEVAYADLLGPIVWIGDGLAERP